MWAYVHLAQEAELKIPLADSRELHLVVQRAAAPTRSDFTLWASVPLPAEWERGQGLLLDVWEEECLAAFFLPFTICPQPSATTLVMGFLGCRLYLIGEETKAEGIDVHSSCSMTTARHSGDCKMMSSHQPHRPLGSPTLSPTKHSLSSTTVPDLHWVDSGSNPSWARTGCDLRRVIYVSMPWVPQI